MKIIRSSKVNLKFSTADKRRKLEIIMLEYSKAVNFWINRFWVETPENKDLLKSLLDEIKPFTKLSYRMISESAREAVGMIKSAKTVAIGREEEPVRPTHRGNKMQLSSRIALLQETKTAESFDRWLHVYSIGLDMKPFDIPIRQHIQFNQLLVEGNICSSIVIMKNHVMFSFEIDTGPKLPPDKCVGIDTGIKTLAALSTGERLGTDIESYIKKINRKKHGSKSQQRSRRALRQRIDEIAKEVINQSNATLIVVERLKGITKNTRKRMVKPMRNVIGSWNVRHWLTRLQQNCERNRVSFRTVQPYYTSQTCSACGHVDKNSRHKESFSCTECGHTEHADTNAAKNILSRYLSGKYGSGCEALRI